MVPNKRTSENIPIHKLYEINISLRLIVLMTSERVQASTNNITSNFGIILTVGLVRGIKQILTGSINIERTQRKMCRFMFWRDFIEAYEAVKLRSSFFWDVAVEVVVEAVVVVVNIMIIIITVNICCS